MGLWVRPQPGVALVLGLFVVLQAVAAISFRRIDSAWPNGRLNWDGDHYLSIATVGYPAVADSMPVPDLQRLAFHPLYPMIVRLLSGGDREIATYIAPVLSLLLAALALLVAGNWVSERFGPAGPLALLAGLALWPSFPVLQMGYTEGLGMLLVVVALRSLEERRHEVFVASVLLVGLTRPLAAPLVIVALWHFWDGVREGTGWRRLLAPGSAVGAAVVAVFLWPTILGATTGRTLVYFEAMKSFRVPGHPASLLAAGLESPAVGAALLLVLAGSVWAALRFLPDGTPTTLRTWLAVYPPYILSVAVVSTSPLRYLMLAFPFALMLVPALTRSAARYALVLCVVPVSVMASSWWIQTFVSFETGLLP